MISLKRPSNFTCNSSGVDPAFRSPTIDATSARSASEIVFPASPNISLAFCACNCFLIILIFESELYSSLKLTPKAEAAASNLSMLK